MRLRIVEALLEREHAVGELVDRVAIQQSGVSRHLGILQRAGFVSVRPEGQRRVYALRKEPFQELDAWVAQFRATWEARLDRLGAELERRRRARTASPEGSEEP